MAGENSGVIETGSFTSVHPLDTVTITSTNNDVDASVGVDTSSGVEVNMNVADSIDTDNSRCQFDTAERQSATLYVSRLSHFVTTLVSNTTSSVSADKLIQDFSSAFCTGCMCRPIYFEY